MFQTFTPPPKTEFSLPHSGREERESTANICCSPATLPTIHSEEHTALCSSSIGCQFLYLLLGNIHYMEHYFSITHDFLMIPALMCNSIFKNCLLARDIAQLAECLPWAGSPVTGNLDTYEYTSNPTTQEVVAGGSVSSSTSSMATEHIWGQHSKKSVVHYLSWHDVLPGRPNTSPTIR